MDSLFVPRYADFLKERLVHFFSGPVSSLDEKQLYGVLLTSAYSTHNKSVIISNIVSIASDFVDASTIKIAKSAAALAGAKFGHPGLPCLNSDININGFEQCNKPYVALELHESVGNARAKDDIDFQLFLLAASFIVNFDNYIDMLIKQKSISKSDMKVVIPIAAAVQSIAEKT